MTVKVKTGQSVFDIVVERYGSLEFLEKFLEDNPDYSAASTLASGDVVVLDEGLLDQRTGFDLNNADWFGGEDTGVPQAPVYVAPFPLQNDKTYVEPGQTFYDLAEQLYGRMELLPKLMADNGWDYDDILEAGQEVVVDEELRRKDYVYARAASQVYNNSDFFPRELYVAPGDFIIDHEENIISTHDDQKLIQGNG